MATLKQLPGGLEMFRLDGRVALITGGSRGLGEAMARALAGAGAELMLVSRHADYVQAVARAIAHDCGCRVEGVAADVTGDGEIQRMVAATLAAFGRIDILINNAGINIRKPSLEMSEQEWAQVIDLNLTAPFLCARAVAPGMIERKWGRIINIGSMLGLVGLAGRAPYTSAKGGLIQLTRTLALEWAPYGITVNAICPGPFMTPLNEPVVQNPEANAAFIANIPLGRWGDPPEIGGLTVLLSSDASSFITGSALTIDGGWTAR